MRSLTAAQEKNNAKKRKTEVALLEMTPIIGGGTHYFSTHNINVGGQQYLRYIDSWSGLSRTAERITSKSPNPNIRIDFLNKRYKNYSFLSQMDDDYPFTYASLTIKTVALDDYGVQDEPLIRFVGRIDGIDAEDREKFSCGVSHLSYYLTKLMGQSVVNLSDYPLADSRSIGMAFPWNFGNLVGVPCVPVNPGAVTTLAAGLVAGANTVLLTEAQGELPFPASGSAMVDGETFSWTGKSGHTLTGVTGINKNHNMGAQVGVVQSYYDYIANDGPMGSITGVLVDTIRQSVNYTAYTGLGASQHPLYSNTAAVRFNVKASVAKQVNVGLMDPGHAHQLTSWVGNGSRTSGTTWAASGTPGWTTNQWASCAFMDADGSLFLITGNSANSLNIAILNTTSSLKTGSYVGTILQAQVENVMQDSLAASLSALGGGGTLQALFDGNFGSLGTVCIAGSSNAYITTTRSMAVADKGYIIGIKLCSMLGNSGSNNGANGYSQIINGSYSGQSVGPGGGNSATLYRTAGTLTKAGVPTWNELQGMQIKFFITDNLCTSCLEQYLEVYYVPYGSGTANTGDSLTGNTVAETVIGKEVTIEGTGYPDDGSGTYTGSPNSLIRTPAYIIKYLLMAKYGLLAGEIGASLGPAAAAQAAAGYVFDFQWKDLLKTRRDDGGKTIIDLIDDLAFQSRSVFYWGPTGTAELAFIPSTPPASAMTIKEAETVTGFAFGRTSEQDIYNRIEARYDYIYSDNPITGAKKGNWAGDSTDEDSGPGSSQAKYGIFFKRYDLWAVRNGAQVPDWLAFRIQQEKDRLLPVQFDINWNKGLVLEPGDTFDIEGPLHNGMQFWSTSVEHLGEGFYRVNGLSWTTVAPPPSGPSPFIIGSSTLGGPDVLQ